MKIHTLASGATVIVTSPGHGFQFSDGTFAEPQDTEVCDRLNCRRELYAHLPIKGMGVNEVSMVLDGDQLDFLKELCAQADIVLIPFPVLTALRNDLSRHKFPNALAMNSTPETMREPPNKKVVDLNNWSY